MPIWHAIEHGVHAMPIIQAAHLTHIVHIVHIGQTHIMEAVRLVQAKQIMW